MFTLWGLVLLLDDHPLAGCVLWGAALATKLQSAFLFPLLIVLFMKKRVQLGHMLALAAAAFVCQMAIVLDGQGIMSMITRYAVQLDNARWSLGLTDGMPNVYALMRIASVREFSGMGLYLATLLAFACASNRRRMIAAGLMEFVSLCAYIRAIFGFDVVNIMILALLAIAGAVLVMLELFEIIFVKKSEEAPLA